MNPGGQQLSSDEILIPSIYYYMAIVWGAILGVWALISLRWRQYSNGLHITFTIVAIITLIYILISYLRYGAVSRNSEFFIMNVAISCHTSITTSTSTVSALY